MIRMQRFMGGKKNQANESIKAGERSIWDMKHHRRAGVSGDASPNGKKFDFAPSADASFKGNRGNRNASKTASLRAKSNQSG